MSGWRGYAIAIVAVAAASVAVALLGPLHLTNGSMLYLGAVLVVAVVAGRWPAVAAAIGGFLALNYLFTEPRFTLAVTDPDAVIALFAFLVVAVVISQLAAALRERALEASEREQEAHLLHDIATLLATQSFRDALQGVGERLASGLDVEALGIDLDDPGTRSVIVGDAAALREAQSRGTIELLGRAEVPDGGEPGQVGRWRRVMRPHASHRPGPPGRLLRAPIGTAGATGNGSLDLMLDTGRPDPDERFTRIVGTVAGQLALAAEQERLRRASTDAEVLRKTDELRGRLLDAVSHDLRTPLASIIAASGSLQQTEVDWSDDDVREFAAAIEQEAARLDRIVGNLLDLGRIRDGTLVPAREWQDPTVVLEDAVERLRAGLPSHEIELSFAPDIGPVMLDAVEIDQVVANLVENAARASPPGSRVGVVVSRAGDELRVAVEDHGGGLPPGPPERLFEPFVHGDAGSGRIGSGLGLAVARGLVQAHGGRIWAENRRGGGARFEFALPAPSVAEPVIG